MTSLNLRVIAPVMVALSLTILSPRAHAQGIIPEPGNRPSQQNLIPEPPGDGPWTPAAAETAGDPPSLTPVPTGVADKSTGVHQPGFGVALGRDTTVAHLHRNQNVPRDNAKRAQSQGVMMTLRPDQLSANQLNAIQGILGVNLMSGDQTIDIFPTDAQLDSIQQVLAPYPAPNSMNAYTWDKKTDPAQGPGWTVLQINRKHLDMNAAPAPGYPKPGEESIYDFQGPLPTVRKLSRLFVLIGVVSATIFMAFAAYSVVLGHREGTSRVIGTAAGLLLLISAYTIWKIVNVNAFAFRGMPNPRLDTDLFNRPQVAPVSDTELTTPAVPRVPVTVPAAPNRSGIPVRPLWGG